MMIGDRVVITDDKHNRGQEGVIIALIPKISVFLASGAIVDFPARSLRKITDGQDSARVSVPSEMAHHIE